MGESKSTDKLIAMNDIVKTTLASLSQVKRDTLKSINITWTKEEGIPVPILSIVF